MIWFFLSVLFASNAMLWWRLLYLESVAAKLEFEQMWRPGK